MSLKYVAFLRSSAVFWLPAFTSLSALSSDLPIVGDENTASSEELPSAKEEKPDTNVNFFFHQAEDLVVGLNTIRVGSSTNEQIVKLQFTSGEIEIDFLSVNNDVVIQKGSAPEDSPTKKISDSDYFIKTSSKLFPYEFSMADLTGVNHSEDITVIINITFLSAGDKGRIAKSLPDIKRLYGGAGAPVNTVGGSARSVGGGIPAGNTSFTETGSTYN